MNFHLSVWHKYRKQADIIGKHIASYQDKKTRVINLDKETLAGYIAHITCILLECSDYMEKCGLTLPPALWKYDAKDPTTLLLASYFCIRNACPSKQLGSMVMNLWLIS